MTISTFHDSALRFMIYGFISSFQLMVSSCPMESFWTFPLVAFIWFYRRWHPRCLVLHIHLSRNSWRTWRDEARVQAWNDGAKIGFCYFFFYLALSSLPSIAVFPTEFTHNDQWQKWELNDASLNYWELPCMKFEVMVSLSCTCNYLRHFEDILATASLEARCLHLRA